MGKKYRITESIPIFSDNDTGYMHTQKGVIVELVELEELEQEEKKLPNQLDNLVKKYCPASECDGEECECDMVKLSDVLRVFDEADKEFQFNMFTTGDCLIKYLRKELENMGGKQ